MNTTVTSPLSIRRRALAGARLHRQLLENSRQQHVETVRFLLATVQSTSVSDDNGYVPLILACGSGRLEVAKFLVSEGADVDAQQQRNLFSSALHAAICCDDDADRMKLLKFLIDAGANVNVRDRNLATPLHAAVNRSTKDRQEMIILLLNAGADITAESIGGSTAIQFAFRKLFSTIHHHSSDYPTRLSWSDQLSVVKLLIDNGACADYDVFPGVSILDQALAIKHQQRKVALLQILFEAGVDINKAGIKGQTRLTSAATKGDFEAVENLLLAGADINARNSFGTTALVETLYRLLRATSHSFAMFEPSECCEELLEVIDMLIDAGAEVALTTGDEAVDSDAGAESPFDIANRIPQEEYRFAAVELLREAASRSSKTRNKI